MATNETNKVDVAVGRALGAGAVVLGGLGLNDSSHSATWLYSGVICAVMALSSAIAAEHRALLAERS
jgi:hypothetical protein